VVKVGVTRDWEMQCQRVLRAQIGEIMEEINVLVRAKRIQSLMFHFHWQHGLLSVNAHQ